MAKISEKTSVNMSRLPILMSRISRSILTLVAFSLVTLSASFADDSLKTAAAPAATPALDGKGEQLFKENCKSCHKVHEESVGPALVGVTTKRSPEWLHSWVKNNAVFRASGDKEAIAIYEKYKKAEMTAFPTLTNEDIDAIFAYVESVPKTVDGPKTPVDGKPVEPQGGQYDSIILGLIVVVLVLVLVAMFIFLAVIKRYLKEKEASLDAGDKELLNQKFDVKAFVRSKGFIAIVALLFVVVAVRTCWVGAQEVGVEQNYAPVQPIAFSHKLHAGDNQINCNYCHTGAYKGKQSNIPSLNICMNCHTYIKEGPKFGKTEIDKLVKAYEAGTPIKWVRVHNLPDLAYFNHSQHTQVAGLECQKCHGPIEEMEVVKQYSNLTMGWCINCHRETAVNSKDNAYYDRLLKVHEESKKKTDMTAEDMGGLDCSKCHY
jgi:mono/diheme cytochrome c family protein/NADH:ubiquinone oxidoreductase subunit 3 (subunit A)